MARKEPVVFGEVLYDCFVDDGSRVLGGAPFNVAWHLQGFGLKPLLISRVGDDKPGHHIEATMQQWHMSTDGLQWDSSYPTGAVSISLHEGQPSFHILSEQAYDYIDAEVVPPLTPSILYHGSLGLRSLDSAQTLEVLISTYRPPVFLDVNLRSPWWGKAQVLSLLEHTDWLKINDDELNTLMAGSDGLEAKALRMLQRYKLKMIIVTQGAAGAFCLNEWGEEHRVVPNHTVEVADTVGAGDAFASVFILGLLKQWPVATILERAQSFASLIVGQRGAILSDANIYKQLLMDWNSRT